MSESSAYRRRRAPGAEAFDRAWGAAIDAAAKKLLDAAFERALVGTDEPVFDRDGNRVGRRLRQSDRLLMRSEEHTSELQSLMRISYAVFCLKKKKNTTTQNTTNTLHFLNKT